MTSRTASFVWPDAAVKGAVIISGILAVIYAVWVAADISDIVKGGLLTSDGQPVIGGDFVNFWTGARLTLAGRVHDLFDFDVYRHFQGELLGGEIKQLHWSYPPHILPLIAVFGLLSYLTGYVLWTALTFGAFALAVAFKRSSPWLLSFVLFFSPAGLMNNVLGQNGFLSAALLVGGLRLLNSRPVWAGILFGLLSFKPQLGLLLPFALIAGRHWRALGATLITTGILVAFSLLLFGVGPWFDYLHVTMPFQRSILMAPVVPFPLFQNLMPTPFMALRIMGASTEAAVLGAGIFFVVAAGAVVATFRRRGVPEDLRAGIFLTALLLATPHLLVYDMTSLSAAVIFALPFASRSSYPKGVFALLLAVWLLPIGVPLLNLATIPLSPLIIVTFLAVQLSWTGKRYLS